MPDFRTQLLIPEYPFQINHQNPVFSIGSCFAENMSQRLHQFKFSTLVNPYGILYNPLSIANAFDLLLSNTKPKKDQLFQNQGLWHSFEHHGSFSSHLQDEALMKMQNAFEKAHHFFKQSNRLLITLGTANVFVLKESGAIVANCHKLPGSSFDRKRLSVKDITERLSSVFNQLKRQTPDLEIITTVSPIRHIRDGLIENQRSKATLLLALDELTTHHNFVHYFPAYEIQMDDLRDYRFYERDMIHPSQHAIDYIWDLFSKTFFEPETRELIKTIEKINLAANHKPFHPGSEQHQAFLKKQLGHIEKLEIEFPFLNFEEERHFFLKQIH